MIPKEFPPVSLCPTLKYLVLVNKILSYNCILLFIFIFSHDNQVDLLNLGD